MLLPSLHLLTNLPDLYILNPGHYPIAHQNTLSSPTEPDHLSEILNIHILTEPNCLAFSSSNNSRCKNTINTYTREKAYADLDIASNWLNPEINIDRNLITIAGFLLCTADHQFQVQSLVTGWKAKIEISRSALRQKPPNTTLMDMEHALIRSLYGGSGNRQSTADESMISSGVVREGVQRVEEALWHPTTMPAPRPLIVDCVQQRLELSTSTSRSIPPTVRTFDPQVVPVGMRPRPVEGECRICMFSFFAEVSREGIREYNEKEKETFRHRYDNQRWVWCRNDCGTNYHRHCLNEWIRTLLQKKDRKAPTCPICRKLWVY
ncbi:hypothetical protein BDV29DRAFT_135548 [Aspergillus leporis]|jgi:hypothetical protein|uniref:RING-type domain-containing protein n=1 Tax=Aspergillus leporis TaxID=41062 RepID=A0A5N5WY85_9EURO|nr:hypothetical protein BDV29DRAFT_135548 [Aspergillus leporis]